MGAHTVQTLAALAAQESTKGGDIFAKTVIIALLFGLGGCCAYWLRKPGPVKGKLSDVVMIALCGYLIYVAIKA